MINEARTLFPAVPKGSYAFLEGYQEMMSKHNLNTSWQTRPKYVNYTRNGAFVKVVEIDETKKEYTVEVIAGVLGESSYRHVTEVNRNGIFLRVKKNGLSSSDSSETSAFLKMISSGKFDRNSKVTFYEKNLGASLTRSILGVAVNKSREEKALYYYLKDYKEPVSEKDLQEEVDLKDEETQDLVAEEIAKRLKTSVDTSSDSYKVTFDVNKLEGKDLVKGTLFFLTEEERNRFLKELKELIEKRTLLDLQKVMNNGEPSFPEVHKGGSVSFWEKASVVRTKLSQVAATLKIDVKKLLHEKRGKIQGKKFGI